MRCYSPSLVIKDHFEPGDKLPLPAFMDEMRAALNTASDRVRAKYGFACSLAMGQLAKIEVMATRFGGGGRDHGLRRMNTADATPNVIGQEITNTTSKEIMDDHAHHHAVVIIGAGQAGLLLSCLLSQRGVEHLVLEKHDPVHAWREQRWDSFCLVTPNWQCALPGWPYAGDDPHGFMTKAEIVAYLEGFVRHVNPPLLDHVTVQRVTPRPNGGYDIQTSKGTFTADQVVAASGGYHQPIIPRLAERLPADIVQLHPEQYRNP